MLTEFDVLARDPAQAEALAAKLAAVSGVRGAAVAWRADGAAVVVAFAEGAGELAAADGSSTRA